MKDIRMIRVLHIANGDDCLGSARCLYEILRYELECEDIEPIVLTPMHTGINDFCDKNGIENYNLKYCGFMYPEHDKTAAVKYLIRKAEYYINKNISVKRIQSRIDFTKIDIIHTNNCLNDIGLILSQITKTKHIWHLREGGLYPQNLHPYITKFAEYMSEGNSNFIAVSNSVKSEWVRLGIAEETIKVIYDGVSLPTKDYPKVTGDRVRFVMIGAYSETKGQIQVIKAVSMMPEYYKNKIHVDFWGVGVPEYIDYLQCEINQNKLKGIIEIRGICENVWQTLASYDVGMNCTRFEAFGRSTIEFLMSGIPVIASKLGANTELINNTNGMLYEYENIEELQQVMIYMVDNFMKYDNNIIAENAKKYYDCDISNKNIVDYFKLVYGAK